MIFRLISSFLPGLVICFGLFSACTPEESDSSAESDVLSWSSVQDSSDIVVSIGGFSGPEAVRYDPGQDVYFIANFNGDAAGDANGFISKMSVEGDIEELEFMTGTDEYPMHGPRGMYISGDMLWAADADGIHGFNRMSGEQEEFIDFTAFELGFLNDIVEGAGGNLYVTDTGTSSVYVIENGTPELLIENLPAPPNGIGRDGENQIVLAPWGGALQFIALDESELGYTDYVNAQSGGNFDGIEFLDGRMIAASQVDSTLHVLFDGEDRVVIHVPGRPADIGIDTERRRVAVPYIALDRVDIWQLPE
ncbi:MAG TPA: hypothetical protein VKM37_01415 [Balneolaceae bacterium]|nr:hypothetical protein [Balneolaceae bacterium]